MAKIIVDLVRYDTLKTTKRKRSNVLVDEKTEASVIEKLEKIHKGDKVKEIFEIVWGGEHVSKKQHGTVYTGSIKFFDDKKGFGFIEADNEDMEDLFFHSTALGGAKVYEHDSVEFETAVGKKGLVAIHIKYVEDE